MSLQSLTFLQLHHTNAADPPPPTSLAASCSRAGVGSWGQTSPAAPCAGARAPLAPACRPAAASPGGRSLSSNWGWGGQQLTARMRTCEASDACMSHQPHTRCPSSVYVAQPHSPAPPPLTRGAPAATAGSPAAPAPGARSWRAGASSSACARPRPACAAPQQSWKRRLSRWPPPPVMRVSTHGQQLRHVAAQTVSSPRGSWLPRGARECRASSAAAAAASPFIEGSTDARRASSQPVRLCTALESAAVHGLRWQRLCIGSSLGVLPAAQSARPAYAALLAGAAWKIWACCWQRSKLPCHQSGRR